VKYSTSPPPEHKLLPSRTLNIPNMRSFPLLVAAIAALPSAAVAQSFDVMETTIAEVHQAAGRLTCRQLVQAYLDRIAAYDKRGPALNAIQNVNPRATSAD
jgi:hypothetical protein